MKYQIVEHAGTVEAIGAYSGYRVRMPLESSSTGHSIRIFVRGSESEEEIEVDAPSMVLEQREDAFEHGYAQAALWIDAENKRILRER